MGKGKYVKTPKPTKYEPHSYDDGMSHNWKKPSYPKKPYKKSQKPAWKKDYSKPTAPQEYDHEPMYESETYDKEPVYSWFQNPYNDRTRRSAVKAQLEERIDADMQELAALDALELDETEVSDEQQDEDGEGVIELASSHGRAGAMCSSRWSCQSNCCERGRCVEKVRDWANIHYCPSECRGWAFAPTGTC